MAQASAKEKSLRRYLLSGVLNDMHMPDQGWSEFWNRFAQDLDVRLSSPVTHLDRDETLAKRRGGPKSGAWPGCERIGAFRHALCIVVTVFD